MKRASGQESLFRDPLTEWDGDFPYDVLAAVGITPDSSMREIREASFTLMAQGGMTPRERMAWDGLRLPAQRLAIDFLLIQGRLPEVEPGVEDADGGGSEPR